MGSSGDWDMIPPKEVKGMTSLERDKFKKIVRIPGMKVPKTAISKYQKTWKSLLLKIRGVKPVTDLTQSDPLKPSHSLILLDPEKLGPDKLTAQQKETLNTFCGDFEAPELFEIELNYNNWSAAEVMRAVLPSDADNVTSFTQIGHIAHLNLKPESLPYKALIGEVILDKIASVKTVVNKLSSIDNTYRNFSMELLAGETNYITQVKEHHCVFELDFSKVYWNSRLGTEHHRVVDTVERGSVVYDVFAGIGPFAIPLAKKKQCTVLANDLNPTSYEYLVKNIKLNAIKSGHVDASNLDGRKFILTVVKDSIIHRLEKLRQGSEHTDVASLPKKSAPENHDPKSSEIACSKESGNDVVCIQTNFIEAQRTSGSSLFEPQSISKDSPVHNVVACTKLAEVESTDDSAPLELKSISKDSYNSNTDPNTSESVGVERTDGSSPLEPLPISNFLRNKILTDKKVTATGDCLGVNPSYVIMNLPAMAVEFLDAFNSLLHDVPDISCDPNSLQSVLPQVFCYAFSPKSEMDTQLKIRVEKALGCPVEGELNMRLVRNVAPNKEMVCISFRLWPGLVLGRSNGSQYAANLKQGHEEKPLEDTEPESKKLKLGS